MEVWPSQDDVSQVLSFVPDASEEDIRSDLLRTRNVQRTINNILDGRVGCDTVAGFSGGQSVTRITHGQSRTVMHGGESCCIKDEELSSTDELSDVDLPDVNFIVSPSVLRGRDFGIRNQERTEVGDSKIAGGSMSDNDGSDDEGTTSDQISGNQISGKKNSPIVISEDSNDQCFMPARKAVTSKEFVDFNQENEDSSRHSAESSPNDDLRGFSNFKVRRNSRDKVTEECNKKSNISGGRTRNKQTLSAYSSWTLSSSDSDSGNSPPCEVADSKQTTISLSGYKDSAKKSKTLASRRNMASSTWCISSSSEEDYEMLPLSLTSRLKQRLQGKSNSVDSQVSSYLGSLATDSTSNSESQSGLHSNATSETSPERFSVMKRRNVDDREVVSRDNNLDNIDDGTPGPKKKKTRRSPEQIAEAKKLALLQRKEREKERAAKHQQKEEMKQLKEREKMQKLKEREEKKLGKEREMARKKAERQVQRATRPEECIKYVSTILDQRLVESQSGADILVHLQSKELKYSLTEQAIENAVTWQREILQVESQDSQSSCLSAGITEEPEVLVILQMSQFVEMVHSYKEEQYGSYSSSSPTQLRSYAVVTKDIYDGKNLTLVVIGMERYFRDVKSTQNKEYRSAVLGDDNHDGKKGKRKKKFGMTRIVSRIDVEEALVDLQLHVNCNVRFTETTTEAAELIAMFTKAVAETPFKRERDKGLFSFHVSNEWAGGVKVDKDGKGLLKVWRQQLQQFRNVSVDVSSAIVSVYPSPQLLIQAYQKCSTVKEAEKLLQDIVVRRGAGVLATTRRVGPELSRRVYLYMTGDDGDLVLHSR